jgi:23S rRNA-/tRNA-specific pseudouridylate synthase
MAFDKPAGLLVHPFPDGWPTLIDQARLICSNATLMHRLTGDVRCRPRHKIVEGNALARQGFSEENDPKSYWPLTRSRRPTGTIDAPLGQAEVRKNPEGSRADGGRAVTGFRVLQSFGGYRFSP